ncbi:MAG: PepSY domain-containing protein [Gammaproteobacteria bacterium]|nr:PepSY domain-containing protein [Gammaproteobacteria bacterium]MDP6652538.1 PepSY domain-containing protein [Gammaproteobacteria bacterium]
MKSRDALHITVTLLLAMAGFSHGQTMPVQQDQNQLNRANSAQQIRPNPQANAMISERQAVNLAQQQFTGNILRISLIGEGDNRRYQIRMENEGKVFTVFVHAFTGRVTGGS